MSSYIDMHLYRKNNGVLEEVSNKSIFSRLFFVGVSPSPESGKEACDAAWKKCLELKEVHVYNHHDENDVCWMQTFHFSKEELEKELKEKGYL